MHLPTLSVLATTVAAVAGLTLHPRQAIANPTNPQVNVTRLSQFPNGTWVENLAVRKDNSVLVTTVTPVANVYLQHPNVSAPILIARWTNATSAFGITEYGPDTFAVAVGNRSVTAGTGTFVIYSVDLRSFSVAANGTVLRNATISRIAAVPNANIVNGLATLDPDTILGADSFRGVVWRINVGTSSADVALNNTLLAAPTAGGFGVNGLTVVNGSLWFSNSARAIIGRVPIWDDGSARGNFSVVYNVTQVDDFTVGLNGAVYIAGSGTNTISRIVPGAVSALAGNRNSSLITGATSVRFGRGPSGRNSLFVTTSGGVNAPVNGTYSEGGRVIQLRLANSTIA